MKKSETSEPLRFVIDAGLFVGSQQIAVCRAPTSTDISLLESCLKHVLHPDLKTNFNSWLLVHFFPRNNARIYQIKVYCSIFFSY